MNILKSALFTSFVALLFFQPVNAQENLAKISQMVSDTAAGICDNFYLYGGKFDTQLESDIEGEITALFKKIGSIEGRSDLNFDSEAYIGVFRHELSGQISDARDCRLKVWNDLRPMVFSMLAGQQGGDLGEPLSGENNSFSNPKYIGVANPNVSANGQIESSEKSLFFVFDVIRPSSCKLTESHDAANMSYAIAHGTNREIMVRKNRNLERRLVAGSYYLVVSADRPVFFTFEIFCDKI